MVNTYALNNEKIDTTQAKIWTAQVVISKAETKSKDFAKVCCDLQGNFHRKHQWL